jgi:hypothetical protein
MYIHYNYIFLSGWIKLEFFFFKIQNYIHYVYKFEVHEILTFFKKKLFLNFKALALLSIAL